jgi:CheY-like chemotaxis protein
MQQDILYVEDNSDHAELVLRHLERRFLRERVHHADNGEEALEHLARVEKGEAILPRVVLLDLRLPRVDGFQVLEHIKQSSRLREVPVVVLTTSNAKPDVDRALQNYVNSYLVKPDDLGQLNALLDELSHYWLDTNLRGVV